MRHMEGTMNRFQKTVIGMTAGLAFGGWGALAAQQQTFDGQHNTVEQRQQTAVQQQQQTAVRQQERTVVQQREKTTVQQRTRTGDPSGEQTSATAGKAHTRQLGPGDGTGNQGASPADGTGFGSPGRLGSGPEKNATGKTAGTRGAARGGTLSGPGAGARQGRGGSPSVGGPGGTLCDGSRRHIAMGGAGLGGFGRRGGGRP